MCKVAAYVRVTNEEKTVGYTIKEQVDSIKGYCQTYHHELTEVYADVGDENNRPELRRLSENAAKKDFDMVVVGKIDRLSLSQRENLCVIREVFLKNNIEFVSINDKIDTQKDYGMEILNALDTFISLDKVNRRNQIMSGRVNRAKEGKWHGGGTDPIGYDYIDGKLVVNIAEAAQVRYVYYLYSRGYTLSEISRRMSDFCTKHGGWDHTSTIGNVLDNPLYAGTVHFTSVNSQGNHQPIVDEKTDRLVKMRRARALQFNHQQTDSQHLLSGILYCGNCGARYFPRKYSDGSYKYVCYSRAKTNKKMIKDPNCRNIIIDKQTIERQVIERITELKNNPSELYELIKKRTAIGSGSNGTEHEDIQENHQIAMHMLRSKSGSGDAATQIIEGNGNNGELNRSFQFEEFKLNLSEFLAAMECHNLKYCRHILSLLLERIEIAEGFLTFQWTLK